MKDRKIFDGRPNILPYDYPSLLQYKDAIRHAYWIDTEYNFTMDIQDFKVNISDKERDIIKKTMLAISQIEVNVKTFWADMYKRMPITEIGDVGMTFAECHIEGTEILTPTGWIDFKNINIGDDVMQYHTDTKTISVSKVNHVVCDDFEGDMYKITSNNLEAIVTPNHRIYYYDDAYNIQIDTAEHIGNFSIPTQGFYAANGKIELSFFDKLRLKYIEFFGLNWIDLKDKTYFWATSALLKILNKQLNYSSRNKSHIDIIQMIALGANQQSKITEHLGVYTIQLYADFSNAINKSKVPYKGKVYCVNVDSGVIITRYKDTTFISGNSEVRHKDAYAKLLRILGLEDEFKTIVEIPAIKDRIAYLSKYLDGTRSKDNKMYTKSVLLFSLFIEHVSLFSQFLIMMSFNKERNFFKGISNVVEATSKEEDIHGNFGAEIINIIKSEYPEWFDEEFEELIYSACKKAYKAECKILDWIFEKGELEFLSKETIQHFIMNRFNNSLTKIGMKPIFEVDKDEVQKTLWFELETIASKESDFFYKRIVDYSKKQKAITEDDLF